MIPWLAAALAHGASVTVSPGDDLNSLTASLQPGDVVTFNPGTYDLYDTVYWTGLGTSDAPIVLKAANTSPVVLQKQGGGWVAQVDASTYLQIRGITFAGQVQDTTSSTGYYNDNPSGLYVNNSSDLTIEDCTFRDLDGDALRLDGDSNHLTIRHNEVASVTGGSGVSIGCWDASCWMADSTVEYNLIHDVEGNGLNLSSGTQSSRFQHNVIFRTGDTAIVVRSTNFGPQNTVTGNAMWDGQNDGIYVAGSALIQNNLIFQFEGDGIYSRNDDYDDGLSDVQISHNTIANTNGWAAELNDWYDRDNLVFANNALANPIGYGLRWNDNAWDPYGYGTGTGTYPETTNYVSDNVVTGLVDGFDPVLRPNFILPGGGVTDFVDSENLDFYPTDNSLLRDRGDADGRAYIPEFDFNGTARDGESPDVGAYEYDGPGNVGWTVQEDFMKYEEHEGRNSSSFSRGCCGGGKSDASTAFLPAPLLLGAVLRRRRARRAC